MKWPWPHRRTTRQTPSNDSKRARQQAAENLAHAQAQWPAVREVSESLRSMNRHNHFGDAVERIMRGTG